MSAAHLCRQVALDELEPLINEALHTGGKITHRSSPNGHMATYIYGVVSVDYLII